MVNLKGEHQERGVLVVKSNSHTVLADNPSLSQMYFVYDEARDDAFLKKLVSELNIPGVTYEAMKEESDQQLQATLQILAVNLPIYTVTFEGATPHVVYSGVVEQKPQMSRIPLLKRMALRKIERLRQRIHKHLLAN